MGVCFIRGNDKSGDCYDYSEDDIFGEADAIGLDDEIFGNDYTDAAQSLHRNVNGGLLYKRQ